MNDNRCLPIISDVALDYHSGISLVLSYFTAKNEDVPQKKVKSKLLSGICFLQLRAYMLSPGPYQTPRKTRGV